MELWRKILNSSVRQPAQLQRLFPGLDVKALDAVAETYPMCINPYYLSLVETAGRPHRAAVHPGPGRAGHEHGAPHRGPPGRGEHEPGTLRGAPLPGPRPVRS